MSVERGGARADDRLQILSETMRSFALATGEPGALIETVARRTAEALGAYCGFAVVSDEGLWLEPAAFHDPDPAALELMRRLVAAAEPLRLDVPHPLAQAMRTGQTVHLESLPPELLRARFPRVEDQEALRRLQLGGALFVPLHALGETVGGFTLVRHGPDAAPFGPDDIEFAQNLADHAALAMKNARLLARRNRELAERNHMAERLRLLSELTKEFLSVTGDPAELIRVVARRVSETIGEVCSLRMIAPGRDQLEPVGAHHDPQPERSAWLQRTIDEQPQRLGEGVSGRVAVTGQTVMVPTIDAAFLATLDPRFRDIVDELGIRALLVVALHDRDQVCGVISVFRRDADRPYTEADRQLLEDIAANASLALTNSRLLEASRRELTDRMRTEEVLRRGFLEAAPDPVLIIDAAGDIVLVNSQTEHVFGYARAELVGQPVDRLVALRHDARQQELQAHRQDGSEFTAEVALSPIETPAGWLYAATVRDVTERRRELDERHRKTQEANRLKSEFLANMSHELRTPLNAIIGFAALMHAGKAGPMADLHKEYLGDILSSSRHLLQLINDILDLAKVESGRMEVRAEPVDLHRVASEVRDILRGLAAEKRVHLAIEVGVPDAAVDPRMLKQILYNFLSNAIKFSPDGGRVTLRIAPAAEDDVRIDVIDNGIGIRAEDMSRLFVEFQQLDASTSKRYPGTGLGLALTRRLVEAHGGRVEVSSTLGAGSTFSAVLPRVFAPLRD